MKLTDRYMHETYLPFKAIEIIEEAGPYIASRHPNNPIVTGEDIAGIISSKTNIPLTRITESESEKLLHLEEEIHARIVGQNEAVQAVSEACAAPAPNCAMPIAPLPIFVYGADRRGKNRNGQSHGPGFISAMKPK